MKHKKNMNAIIGGVVGVLVIGGLVVVGMNKYDKKIEPAPVVVEEVPVAKISTPKRKSVENANTPKSTLAVAPTMSYMDSLENFKGRVLQFNQSCGAAPSKPIFKKGTAIMLDNRSDQTRKITVGAMTVDLAPYTFTTTTLDTVGVFAVNCGPAVNVATITVQE